MVVRRHTCGGVQNGVRIQIPAPPPIIEKARLAVKAAGLFHCLPMPTHKPEFHIR
jgi:hypothetical protein